MKWLLVLTVLGLAFGGGAWRTRRLLSTLKSLPRDFRAGRDAAADPASQARDVTPIDDTRR
jgi:hypothetical protein